MIGADAEAPPKAWRGLRLAAVAALIAALIPAVLITYREWVTARFEDWAATDLGGRAPMPWEPPPPDALCGADCPAPALAASAVHLTMLANTETSPVARDALLHDAERRLVRSLAIEPGAGGRWVWLAYVRWIEGDDTPPVVDALVHSYRAAPFLAHEGPARVRLGAETWPKLPPDARARVIDEMVWLRDVDPEAMATARARFTDPDARQALAKGLTRPPARSVPHRSGGAPGGIGAT